MLPDQRAQCMKPVHQRCGWCAPVSQHNMEGCSGLIAAAIQAVGNSVCGPCTRERSRVRPSLTEARTCMADLLHKDFLKLAHFMKYWRTCGDVTQAHVGSHLPRLPASAPDGQQAIQHFLEQPISAHLHKLPSVIVGVCLSWTGIVCNLGHEAIGTDCDKHGTPSQLSISAGALCRESSPII